MAANAKPALEKIRRIQKPKRALFRAIPKNSTKFFSEQRANWSSTAGALLERLRRNLAMALDVLKKGLRSPICRAKVSARTLLSGPTSFRKTRVRR
jgi:hypothetical protein